MKINKQKNIKIIIELILLIGILAYGYFNAEINKNADLNNNEISEVNNITQEQNVELDLSTVPEYSNKPYVEINNNKPNFTEEEYTTEAFEKYSEWDSLGRSGVAYANICKEIMPKAGEKRGDISSVKNLSGWVQKRYDKLIKDKYLYNRCHLIGWQLAGENANKNNLIAGTRYMNTEGMLPFENEVADYIKNNKSNHALYRVTPIYKDNNLLASGVQMEAISVEDKGQKVCFNVYCYNVQPGIEIDYATGQSHIK